MSRVVLPAEFGGPEVLTLRTVAVPEPGPGEVRVAVRAVGTNRWDYKSFSGTVGRDPALLRSVGTEVAGTVDAVGDDLTGFEPGDRVVVPSVPGPAYADHVLAPADTILRLPGSLGFEEAAGLMMTATTAVHLLEATRVADGDTVLVHGATGGVGSAAVQLAIHRGARVIGTASEPNHGYLHALGAQAVAYGPGLLDRVRDLAPDGIDAALDAVGTDEAVEVSVALVEDRSRIATVVAFEPAGELGFAALGYGPGGDPGSALRKAARPEVLRLAGEGALKVEVARTYPLEETANALRDLASGHTRGKIVVVP